VPLNLEYAEVSDPTLQTRICARYEREMSCLRELGFRNVVYYRETLGPFSAIRLLLITLMCLIKREVLLFPFPLRLASAHPLLFHTDSPAIVLCTGLGIKIYTGFTDGTLLISSDYPSHRTPSHNSAVTRNPASHSIQDAWYLHQKRTRELAHRGKSPQTGLSFQSYIKFSEREETGYDTPDAAPSESIKSDGRQMRFQLTANEYLAAHRLYYRRSRGWQFFFIASWLIAGLLGGKAAFHMAQGDGWELMAVCVAYASLLLFTFGPLLSLSARRDFYSRRFIREPVSVTFDDWGIEFRTPSSVVQTAFDEIRKIVEDSAILLLVKDEGQFHVLPKRAFATSADGEIFREVIRQRGKPASPPTAVFGNSAPPSNDAARRILAASDGLQETIGGEYQLTEEEFVQSRRMLVRASFLGRHLALLLWIALPVLLGLSVYFFAAARGKPFGRTLQGIFVVVGLLCTIGLAPRAYKREYRRTPALRQHRRLAVDANSIFLADETSSGRIDWEDVQRCIESATLIVLDQGTAIHVIPKRAFASATDCDAFCKRLRTCTWVRFVKVL
jgi:hypothetical protein